MNPQPNFLSGGTLISLDHVVDVVQPPVSANPRDEEIWLMVMMEDGTFSTIKGQAATEAFLLAMDRYLKTDLS